MMLAALHMDEAHAHQKATSQNDELARQIALLEHAKSQAAIQQAQARQAVQMRQEHMAKERDHALARSKVRQALGASSHLPVGSVAHDRALHQTDGAPANGVRIPAAPAV